MTDEQIIEAWKAAGRLDTVGDNLQQAVAMVRALLADGGKGEAVYQIRSTNAGTWHDVDKERYESTRFERRIVYTAPQAECAPREAQPVLEAMQGYLRQCRCGGMTKKVSDQIERAVSEASDLGYFAAPTPEREAQPVHDPRDIATPFADAMRSLVPTPERARESARLPTDDEIREIWMRETGTTEQDSPLAILDFARAVIAANKEK